MTKLALSVGNLSLALVYLLFVAINQIYLHNDTIKYAVLVGLILILFVWSFWKVHSMINYKSYNKRNIGLKTFKNIVPERKVGLQFIVINLLPLVNINLFEIVPFSVYMSKLVTMGLLLIFLICSKGYVFNPYFVLMGFHTYKSLDQDNVLLMRKNDYGSSPDYQMILRFEKLEYFNTFIVKDSNTQRMLT